MRYHRNVMKKSSGKIKLILFTVLVMAVFFTLCAITAVNSFSEKKANESFSEVDYYSMQKFSDQSANAVFSALKSGKTDKLKNRMLSSDGLDELMAFADWSQADFDSAIGLGAGSLSPAPDESGRMDMSERFFVDIGDSRYVLMIETVASRWGRTYNGISSISATTYDHFDGDLDWDWLGEPDDASVMAGELFWQGNQPAESSGEEEAAE